MAPPFCSSRRARTSPAGTRSSLCRRGRRSPCSRGGRTCAFRERPAGALQRHRQHRRAAGRTERVAGGCGPRLRGGGGARAQVPAADGRDVRAAGQARVALVVRVRGDEDPQAPGPGVEEDDRGAAEHRRADGRRPEHPSQRGAVRPARRRTRRGRRRGTGRRRRGAGRGRDRGQARAQRSDRFTTAVTAKRSLPSGRRCAPPRRGVPRPHPASDLRLGRAQPDLHGRDGDGARVRPRSRGGVLAAVGSVQPAVRAAVVGEGTAAQGDRRRQQAARPSARLAPRCSEGRGSGRRGPVGLHGSAGEAVRRHRSPGRRHAGRSRPVPRAAARACRGSSSEVMAYNLATAHRPQPVLARSRRRSACRPCSRAARSATSAATARTCTAWASRLRLGQGQRPQDQQSACSSPPTWSSTRATRTSPATPGWSPPSRPSRRSCSRSTSSGAWLRTIGDPKKAPHLFNVISTLMKMYSSARSVFKGKAYADAKRNKVVDQPCVSVYGTTVPEHFYESLTADSLSDGFIARLLVFETGRRRRRGSGRSDPPSPRRSWLRPRGGGIVHARRQPRPRAPQADGGSDHRRRPRRVQPPRGAR